MKNKDKLDLKRRREIYEFVSQNPGLHTRGISRKMDIPFSSLKYHLNYLEKRELISSRVDGKYKRYFISLGIGEGEKKILSLFQKKSTLHILFWFFIVVQCTQKELGRYMEQHPTTIGFHLRKMKRTGIIGEVSVDNGVIHKETLPSVIKRRKISNEKIYVLKDPWMIYDLLLKHKDNLIEKELVNGIIDYVEFYISDGIPKQIQNREDTIDSVIKVFSEFFFPPSFCS